jgi:hypothetical protein
MAVWVKKFGFQVNFGMFGMLQTQELGLQRREMDVNFFFLKGIGESAAHQEGAETLWT